MRTPFKALQRTLSILALTLAGFVSAGTAPAHALADNYVFGFTGGVGNQDLILNGGEYVIQATTEGWVNSDGVNNGGAGNYAAGNSEGVNYEDYFTFSLAGVSGPITSAVVSLWNPGNGFTGNPNTFTLHGIDSAISTITTGGIDLFNTIAASDIVGTANINNSSNGTNVLINVFGANLAGLARDEGSVVAAGGTFGPVSAVPLPAGLPMFAFALLSLFAAVQFGKKRKLA